MTLLTKPSATLTPLDAAVRTLRPAIVVAIVFSLFINVLALVSPMYMLQVYDRVLNSKSVMTLVFLTLICVFLFGIAAALESLRTNVLVRGGIGFDGVSRSPTFKSVLEGSIKREGAGPQAFRDLDQVRSFLTASGLIAFCDVPWIPVFVVVAFILHPYFGVLSIIAGLVILALAVSNDYATRQPLVRASAASIAAQNDVSTTLRNAEVMHAMGMWQGLQRRWEQRRDDLIAWQAQASDRGGRIMATIKFVRQAVQTLILGGGAYLAITGKLSPGAMIAASILVGRALAPIEMAVGQWKNFIEARASWDRLQATFRATPEIDSWMPLPAPHGKLLVENASIGPPRATKPTLRDVAFALDPGTTLGVIGPSASGKSSLVRGIVGVWPLLSGVIRVDGFDLKQWDPQQLGRYIGYLPQDVELFSGTVADNISRFSPFEVDEVIDAARLAGVHEMIQAMPNGYDTQIGDGGTSLSGGQRQRLALARTVFRRPPLLILDEPNANLDTAGELALEQAILQLKATSAIILITHKMNLLRTVDKVLLLQNGQVARYGDRDQVLSALLEANNKRPAPARVS